jgi:hypothetical protein
MRTSAKIVWLGYASIAFSIVWGVPGLACAWYALRLSRTIPIDATTPASVRRDVRGGRLLARVGASLSILVILVVLWSIISTLIWMG